MLVNYIETDCFFKNPAQLNIKFIFSLCKFTDAIESRANQPLINIITAFGGWLSTSNTISYFSQLDFADIVLKLKELGVNFSFLIAIDIGPDLKNTSNNIIAVSLDYSNFLHSKLSTKTVSFVFKAKLIIYLVLITLVLCLSKPT